MAGFRVYKSVPSENRTRNPQLRRLVLYPVELWAQTLTAYNIAKKCFRLNVINIF